MQLSINACALSELYFLEVRVCLPTEETMFLKVTKYVLESQSKECWLITFYYWKLRFLKVQSSNEIGRNCKILIIEGIRDGDAVLKDGL